jgi:alpha-beta hydrolase superfamily lysophospholipase
MIDITRDKAEIQAQMAWLAGQNGGGYAEAVQSYFEHYGLDWPHARHHFGWFESRGLKLAGHVWMPNQIKNQKLNIKIMESPEATAGITDSSPHKGVRNDNESQIVNGVLNDNPLSCETAMVIVLHGYLNHTGQMKHLIASLLEAGFAVGSFDLHGHGLSEGPSAAVGAFGDYTQALLDFVLTIRAFCSGPLHFVGFSTGAAVGVDWLRNHAQASSFAKASEDKIACACHPKDIFDKMILAAPLIRWRGYNVSKATYAFCRVFTDKIRRMPQRNSSDNNFLSFNRHDDYLHGRYVALDWVKALYDWNARLTEATPCDKKVFILQGDRDTTVDWRYNLGLLQEKFPAANVQMIKGARHELFNERAGLREACLVKITDYLLDTK